MTGALLDVRDLTVRFTVRGAVVQAVDGVTLRVDVGETFGLIGESGSGKSTVARAVMGLAPVTSGTVSVEGVRLSGLRGRQLRQARRSVGMVFQDPHDALDPRMTAMAAVAEPMRIGGLRGAAVGKRVLELFDRVGLGSDLAERGPHELSGGQKQRVNIARALALEPRLLICDEAVSALDVSVRAGVLNLLVGLQRDLGLSYLFISHDLAVVAHVADRVGVMYLGRLMEVGLATAMVGAPKHPYTEALLSAEPQPVPSRLRAARRIVLQGDVPSPLAPPSGCRFRTRCRYAAERCAQEVPELREVAPERWVACHFADSLTLGGWLTHGGGAEVSP